MLELFLNKSYRQNKMFFVLIIGMFYLGGNILFSQTAPAPKYQMPPKALADLVDAPPTPNVDIDPTNTWLLILERPNLESIEVLAQPELRIAGVRINPRTNSRSRRSYYTGMKLKSITGGEDIAIVGLPESARIRNVNWSSDGNQIAFLNEVENGQNLWVVDVASKQARMLIATKINSVSGAPFHWLSENKSLICKVIPADRGEAPAAPVVPAGPVIQETTGKRAPARTYQDLLKNEHDAALFEYYMQAQIMQVNLDGKNSKLGSANLIGRAEPSPDGKYLVVETVHRPFSYIVPVYRFPALVEIWDLAGKVVKQIADLPLAEEIPIGRGAVPTGPRSIDWRSDAPATLYWTEAQDDGNPRKKAEIRDHIYTLSAPFSATPKLLASLGNRFSGIRWGNANLALVSERWWKTRNIRTWIIKPDAGKVEKTLLFDYSWQDRYNDPGAPMTVTNSEGHRVLLMGNEGKTLYLTGAGASAEGDRPFLNELDLTTKNTKLLWRSEEPYYEYPIRLLNIEELQLLTLREAKDEPPNYFMQNISKEKTDRITRFPHPTPQLADAQKELIRYKREDGVDLSANLYLPPGYKPEDGPLPMMVWAYPREFKSKDAASQVIGSPHRFVRVSPTSAVVWLAMGYAVLDGATMPIIGEGDKESNDTYIEQLVSSAKAAVDEVVRRGVTEPGRIAVGGHSYGAFMTANLLAHSDLFSAGIARSGAYNRTLTPFGFQAEERTYWEAPEIYFQMSPFMHANKVNEPILLIHGEADNNSGTFPIQSKRFYAAIKGHGGKARLVMLPHESHGYRSRESIMHMLWETNQWMEKYVKNISAEEKVTDKTKSAK